jgi:hypothetical protein
MNSEGESDLDATLQRRIAEMRRSLMSELSAKSVAWLALPPGWTKTLAKICGFPLANRLMDEFLRKAETSGLCRQSVIEDLEGRQEIEFWMPERARAEALVDLRHEIGTASIHKEALEIAQRLLKATELASRPDLPVILWAQLVDRTWQSLEVGANWFLQRVDERINADDSGGALAWLRVGSSLADMLGGQLQGAVLRATHQIELAFRRAQDQRHLRNYIPRQGQIEAFLELAEGPPRLWALHFLGVGGVGKTMLIRHITTSLAAECGRLTTRVDFDHMSPNFPARRPEQLLVELADELRMHSDQSLFVRFETNVRELQEVLSDEPLSMDPLANIRSPSFDKVYRAFVDWLRQLSRPVVIILDTCEELSKIHLAGKASPSVVATFEILERLQQEVRSMRVVFSGRRLLALSGHQWNAAGSTESLRYLPEKKPFLRLHEIRGFDEGEADEFFAKKGVKLPSEKGMRQVILNSSREVGLANTVDYKHSVEDVPRFNPFDVALYADWVLGDENLTAELISSGRTDPYIEMRIVARLLPEVRELLPSAVLLRRFDKSMLRPAVTLSDAAFEVAFRDLGQQEWTDYQPDEGLQTTFLEIDRKLFPRLLRYYKDGSRCDVLNTARKELAPALGRMVEGWALDRLGVDHIYAALRLLPAEKGAELWSGIDRRIEKQGYWSWANNVASRLLAQMEDLEETDFDKRLRPAILATQTAAALHEGISAIVGDPWTEVLKSANMYPDKDLRSRLLERAIAGKIATSPLRAEVPLPEQILELERIWVDFLQSSGHEVRLVEQRAASLCAAVEGLLELAENGLGVEPPSLQLIATIQNVSTLTVSPAILAFAQCLAGRALALHQQFEKAAASFESAEIAVQAVDFPLSQSWADWRAPASLRDRVRLEWLRCIPSNHFSAPQLKIIEWQEEAINRLDLIDAERLVSRILEWRLGRGIVSDLTTLKRRDQYNSGRQSLCNAHRATRPLFALIGLADLALGNAEKALAGLNARSTQAELGGRDLESIQAAKWVKYQVIRRMRLAKRGYGSASALTKSARVEDVELIWPALAINGLYYPEVPALADQESRFWLRLVHAWWTSQATLDPQSISHATEKMEKVLEAILPNLSAIEQDATKPSVDFDRQSLGWDLQEAAMLSLAFDANRCPIRLDKNCELFSRINAPGLEEAARLFLRSLALTNSEDTTTDWARLLGARRIAELALEEGELLGLRLPVRAARLLDLAHRLFEEAHDPVGVVIASICQTIAAVHANERDLASGLLETLVRPSYEMLVVSGIASDVPSWPQLIKMRDEESDLGRLDDPSWSGWLHRLFRCLLWASRDKGVEGSQRKLAWLVQHYPERLPPELILEPIDRDVTTRQVKYIRTYPTDLVLRSIASTAVGLLVLSLGIEIHANFPGRFSTIEHVVSSSMFLAFVIAWLLYSLGATCLWIRSLVTARSEVELSIVPAPNADFQAFNVASVEPVAFRLRLKTLRIQFGLPPVQLGMVQCREAFGVTPGLRSCMQAKDVLPVEIVRELRRLGARLTGRNWWNRLSIPLRVEPALAPYAWEALLTMALPAKHQRGAIRKALGVLLKSFLCFCTFLFLLATTAIAVSTANLGVEVLIAFLWFLLPAALIWPWRIAGRELHFWRSGETVTNSSTKSEPWVHGCAQVVCDKTWNLMVETGWAALRSKITIANTPFEAKEGPVKKLIHVLGTPHTTRGGLRLQISASAEDEKAVPRGKSRARSRKAAPFLVGPEELPLNSSPLIIVQGEPLDNLAQSETSREQNARLRAFAAELFAAGAGAVILVPSLPPLLAEDVVRILARRLRPRSEPSMRRLLDVVSAVRKKISKWKNPASLGPKAAILQERSKKDFARGQLELALDVVLFGRRGEEPPQKLPASYTSVAINSLVGGAGILGFVVGVILLPGPLRDRFIGLALTILIGLASYAAVRLIWKLRRSRQFSKFTGLEMPFRSAAIIPAELEDIAFVAGQERKVYSPEDAVPETLLREWFLRNPNGFNIINYNKKFIGHVNLLPFKKDFLTSLVNGKAIEKDAKATNLYSPSVRRCIKDLYIESLAISHPSEIVVGRVLLQLFAQFANIVSRLCPMEQVRYVYAIAATPEGKSMLSQLKFEHIKQEAKRPDGHAFYRARFGDLAAILSQSGDNSRRHEALKGTLRAGL